MSTGCVVVTFAVVGAFIILVAILSLSDHEKGNNSDKTDTPPAKFDPATLLPGATVKLRSDGGTAVPVVPTRELYKEWMRLVEAKDTLGAETMINEGQMLLTPNGTRARILESHDFWDGSYNVRVLDGPLYGQAVWTNSVYVKEDKPDETKPSQPSTGHQADQAAPGLAVGDRAIVYGGLSLMATDEQAYEATKAFDLVDGMLQMAKEHRLITCSGGYGADPQECILRTSVVILELGEASRADFDRLWAKVRITGLLRGHEGQVARGASFADEDQVGSPRDCRKDAGEPPYMYYEYVNSIGVVGYVDRGRLRPVDAEGHDIQYRNIKSDVNHPLPAAPIEAPCPGVSMPIAGTAGVNPKDCLKYVWIPPGTFTMGCSPGDNECYDAEKPPHQVTITKGFWLGQTEVTVGAYKRFAVATGRQMPPEPLSYPGGRSLNPGSGDEAMPIVDMTWDDAEAYCRWAGGRLPTEAEWEYAARAGSTAARYGDLDEIAWDADNSGGQRLDSARIWQEDQLNYVKRLNENGNGMHDVGVKRANDFGLYDMLGNVWELVNDRYDENYYKNSPSQDPAGPTRGQLRVQRGGSWSNYPEFVRVSYRYWVRPADRYEFNGFRCVGEVFAP